MSIQRINNKVYKYDDQGIKTLELEIGKIYLYTGADSVSKEYILVLSDKEVLIFVSPFKLRYGNKKSMVSLANTQNYFTLVN